MQKQLLQIDSLYTARNHFYEAQLKDVKDLPDLAVRFTSNVARLVSGNEPRAEADQILCFRSALKDTFFYDETHFDALTNRPFATLGALLNNCRALYLYDQRSRQAGAPNRAAVSGDQRGGSSRGGVEHRGCENSGGRSGGGRFGGGGHGNFSAGPAKSPVGLKRARGEHIQGSCSKCNQAGHVAKE